MAIIKGNVVGRVKIKDLNITLEYKEEKFVPDNQFNQSKDLKESMSNNHIIVIKKPAIYRVAPISPQKEEVNTLPKEPHKVIIKPKQEVKVIEREIIKEVPAQEDISNQLNKFKVEILDIIDNKDFEDFKKNVFSAINEIAMKYRPVDLDKIKSDIVEVKDSLKEEITKTFRELLANNYIGQSNPIAESVVKEEKKNDEPVFIPKVKSDNVKSNIKIEEQKTESVDDSLEAIKKLKRKKKSKR